jgi:hypothetical protein
MPERKLYIGSKLILAFPMNQNEFREKHHIGAALVDPDQEGYCVEYPDGYISWSPKVVFDTAYREVTEAERDMSPDNF